MFSQLQFVRLRAAEKALRDGQLDEALRLATAPDLSGHRRAIAVRAALAEQYVERARDHYRNDRFAEGLSDLDKAEVAGATGENVAELRRNVRIVAHEVRRKDHSRRERIEAARRRIEHGSLAAGQRMLAGAGAGDPELVNLRRDVEHRADDVERLINQARQFADEGQLAAAVTRLERATALDHDHDRLASLRSELCQHAFERVRECLIGGRLARASDELAGLGGLGRDLPERRELADALATGREASAALTAARYADARRHLMSLQRVMPQAKWIVRVLDELKQMDTLLTGLTTGPLGERLVREAAAPNAPRGDGRGTDPRSGTPAARSPGRTLEATIALPSSGDGASPDRLLLLVEGGGSYLILRASSASIGRAASGNPADVPILSDIGERHATIERVDDDYFLVSAKGVELGGRLVHHGLLRDGDRLVLGRRAKFTFRLPSRRSTTAVLDLSDTTKMPHDVRRVVLLSHHATLGDGPKAHIHCRCAGPPLLLVEKDGALWIRQRNDGHVDGEAKRLVLGETVEVGGARVVLSAWKPNATGAA